MQGERLRGASHARAAAAAIAAALIVGACSKGEPQSTKARPNAPLETQAGAAQAPVGDANVDQALKERLARQEAAARLFEKNVLQPTPPKSAEPAKAPEPPRPAAATPSPEPAPAQRAPEPAPRSEPPKVAAATPAATPAPAAPEPVKPAAAPAKSAPRTDVAAAKPAAVAEPPAAKLVSRIEPDFPGEAVRAGVDQGLVRARLTLDNAGNVTKVDIVEAQPRRVFDRAVVRALSQWRFNEGASGRTVESEIAFKR